MVKYYLIATAFKKSGKSYNQGDPIYLGECPSYPAQKIFNALEEAEKDLDKVCNLQQGSVKENSFTVLLQILDNTSHPVCIQRLVHP